MKLKSLFVLLLVSCRTEGNKSTVDTAAVLEEIIDLDGDGFDNREDCDDGNSSINPTAVELCDGIDNNCDGQIDEGVLNTFYVDTDNDGFGNQSESVLACVAEEGFVNNGNDCDDDDATTYPSAPEQCDEVDNDCDGTIDEELQTEWWLDEDGDGFGDPEYFAEGCLAEDGFAPNPDDCDDADSDVHPDMEELCDEIDNNCDGEIDEDLTITVYVDADQDGYGDESQFVDVCALVEGYALVGGDCDDIDSSAFPGGVEICDDVDNNCDGVVDEGVGSPGTIWYDDLDQDGFGDDSTGQIGCLGDPGDVSQGGDCDDNDPDNYPTNIEVCDGQDNNCDSLVDDQDPLIAGQLTYYEDQDADGVGSNVLQQACSQPLGFVTVSGDCNDLDNTVYAGATEICDGIDNTCDGLVDDNDPNVVGQTTFYLDGDGDGVGSNLTQTVCFLPSGYVTTSGDCDDGNTAVYTGAQEVCDGLDNDCDGATDDADSNVVGQTIFYEDGDGDGFGSSVSQTVCNQPLGYVSVTGDCNDGDGTINPNATEQCDGLDNDCDGATDDADSSVIGQGTYYQDGDGDGFGSSVSQIVCNQPLGYVSVTGDCNDGDGTINPNATEQCDGLDNDCDGATDDADSSVIGQTTYYIDSDGDGFGVSATTIASCSPVGGYALNASDCDDTDAAEYPGVVWYTDFDGDGFGNSSSSFTCSRNSSSDVPVLGDCNDGDGTINPNATEQCDGLDNDCDGATDDADSSVIGQTTYYRDLDGDGYGSNVTLGACSQPSGYVGNNNDCNDGSSSIKPGAQEVCDGLDNDCDGATDDADSSVIGQSVFYIDNDGDGYGTSSSLLACNQPGGYATSSGDCNDGNGSVSPGAFEQCDLADNNCNGSIDEGASCTRSIYRGLHYSNGQHLYSTSTVSGGGFSSEGYAFSLYTSSVSGTSALYRCRNYGSGKTFLTTSSNCEGSGMSVDMTLGYISQSGISGTTPLYRLYLPNSDDHFYTTSASEKSYAQSLGYIYEGVPGYVW